MRWFALCVKSRHEKSAAGQLESRGFESFAPLYRATHQWTDRTKILQLPLFPGYVFCRFRPISLPLVLDTRGVFDVVRYGSNLAAIDDCEIEALQNVVRSGLNAEPAPYFLTGETVFIDRGPLAGLQGTVLQNRDKGGTRLNLSVTLLRRSVQVEVDPSWLSAGDVSLTAKSVRSEAFGGLENRKVSGF